MSLQFFINIFDFVESLHPIQREIYFEKNNNYEKMSKIKLLIDYYLFSIFSIVFFTKDYNKNFIVKYKKDDKVFFKKHENKNIKEIFEIKHLNVKTNLNKPILSIDIIKNDGVKYNIDSLIEYVCFFDENTKLNDIVKFCCSVNNNVNLYSKSSILIVKFLKYTKVFSLNENQYICSNIFDKNEKK